MSLNCLFLQVAIDPNAGLKATIFWALMILLVGLFFYFLRRTDRIINKKNDLIKSLSQDESTHQNHIDVPDEEAAAIALAIHLFTSELHDQESLTITLQKVSRIYSPWSSKIYTLRQTPQR
jgi:glutaconyl-CoA/methylmalonyl-CoA decarboxylase subunit delta